MSKQNYYLKLVPPRPTFRHDISEEERHLMSQHAAYLKEHFESGRVLLFGPVMVPNGAFGLAVLDVDNEAEARQFGENDLSVRVGLNRFEICPMRVGGAQASGA